MKAPTINQINGRLAQAPAIGEYLKNSSDYERYQSGNWRNRYFKFFGDGHTRSINGNFIFGAAWKELRDIAQTDDWSRQDDIDMGTFKTIGFTLITRLHKEGLIMQISTRARAMEPADHPGGIVHNFFKVRSNKLLADFDQVDYFKKVIFPKYFYTEGLMMELQLLHNCTKAQVREHYTDILKTWKGNNFVDTIKSLTQRLRKEKNIVVDPDEYFTVPRLLQALRSHDRYKKPTKATKAPSLWEIMEYAESESDDEDGQMEAAESYLINYEKSIFI